MGYSRFGFMGTLAYHNRAMRLTFLTLLVLIGYASLVPLEGGRRKGNRGKPRTGAAEVTDAAAADTGDAAAEDAGDGAAADAGDGAEPAEGAETAEGDDAGAAEEGADDGAGDD